ncbi:hypothetical protein [Streptomyces sp. 8L]|uniref:hypothetical protein n=1 Tax=Streptomyces sp. 8L TaxID=2877242 RepID=UPI001CD48CAE|nr:hypothetical protein [Streptomyces sp. 8L]MCA1221306.1 hypothetical protein [Streptomyces sp. 8L]
MTAPHADGLFDLATPGTAVERLILLADQYVQHNDRLDLLLRPGSVPEPDAHVASAHSLASETRAAIAAVAEERLYNSLDLSETVARLKQLAYLSDASTNHGLATARDLTALAPEAAVDGAALVAGEIRRRRPAQANGPDPQLNTVHYTALWEISRGHVVTTESLGRRYVHYRDTRVLINTLRQLETRNLIERVPKTAPSAYVRGPLQDRVRLTQAGTTALAASISLPPAGTTPGKTLPPMPTSSQSAKRSR